ncbi:DNA polymerase [Theileria orientalis]|uniref:DNA polymerase n=1 Tax=Theileria orientalis TaxID=68886 RepID=A0A976M7F1_THEOR|nr:DNA polymerase [Theileria orientalis]
MGPKSKSNAVESALSRLRNEREGKSTILDEYEVEDENDQLYEIITEEEFNERNKKRKLEDFIEGEGYSDEEFDDFEDDLEILEQNVERTQKRSAKMMPGKSIPQHFIEMAAQETMTYQPPKQQETDKELIEKLSKFEDELDNDSTSFAGNQMMTSQFTGSQMFSMPSYLSESLMQLSTETHRFYSPEVAQSNADKEFMNELLEENNIQNIETLSENALDPSIVESFREVDGSHEIFSAELPQEEAEQAVEFDEKTSEDLAFYLLDLCEGPNGHLHLFGRMRTTGGETETCMITVKNMMRNLFFKPRIDLAFNETGELINNTRESSSNDHDGIITKGSELYERYLMMNFFKEMETVRKNYGIKKIKYKLVKRSLLTYGPTKEELYIKVCYPYQSPQIEKRHYRGTYYEDIYNINATQIELFLLKRKIKGPNWLRINNFRKTNDMQSYCKIELEIDTYKDVQLWHTKDGEILPVPKLKILSVSIKTIFNVPTQQEIFMICCVYNKYNIDDNEIKENNSQFIGVRKAQGCQWPPELKGFLEKRPYFRIFEQERGLLANFMFLLQQTDPDIIVGHDINNSTIDLLVKRCNTLNIPLRISLSRLRLQKRSNQPYLHGRLFCDTRLLIRESHPSRENYNLVSCVSEFLNVKNINDVNYYSRNSFNVNEIKKLFSQDVEAIKHLLRLTQCNVLSAIHTLQLLFKLQILPLTKELTTTAGNTWSRSLQCARSERIDYLLMHEFYHNKYILDHIFEKNVYKDNYQDDDKNEGKKGNSYEGGLVFEPRSGLYDNFVLLLDFNSLYPSIIQEYNICFTTTYVRTEHANEGGNMELDENQGEYGGNSRESEVVILDNVGILPSVLKRLVELRIKIKKAIGTETNELRKSQLKTRQLALKLIANSIYGCIGSTYSRFHCKYIASYITQQGRNLLKSTKEKVENVFNLNVIYGDTDSLMINTNIRDDGNATNYNAANQMAMNLVNFINKSHKKLEIGIDGVFNRLLLLKKKKYASLKVVDYENNVFHREIKGLDFIRRDWSLLTKEVGNQLLKIILNSNYFNGVDGIVQEIHSTLQNINQQLNDQSIELTKYLITKQLTKNPKEYSDIQNLPHVSVALRLNEKGITNYTAGHEVSYIVCTKESSKAYYENTNKEKEEEESKYGKDSSKDKKNASRVDNLSHRAFNINEVKEHNLEVDIHYYKTQQLLPPIIRLCSIIEGTDAQRLSKCLQVETLYGATTGTSDYSYDQECKVLSLIKRSQENYKEVEMSTKLACQQCNGFILPSFFLKYFKCNHCLKWLPLQLLRNWIDRALYEITLQSSFCIRVCNICNVTTLNVSLGNIDRCPQPTCQSNDSMQSILSSNKVYLYYDYLVYMLEGKLNDPTNDPEDTLNSASTNGKTGVTNGEKSEMSTLVNVVIDYNGKMTVLNDEPPKEPKTLDEIIEQIAEENTLKATSGLRLCAEHILGLMESVPFLKYYTLDYQKEREILCNRVKTLQQKNAYSVVNLSDLFKIFKMENRNLPHTN